MSDTQFMDQVRRKIDQLLAIHWAAMCDQNLLEAAGAKRLELECMIEKQLLEHVLAAVRLEKDMPLEPRSDPR